MILRCCKFDAFAKRIREGKKKLVLFGAGAVGSTVVPELLKELDLLQYVDCYIDNDKTKWDTTLEINGRDILIQSPVYLKNCLADNTVLLINISHYSSAIEQLKKMECTKDMDSYIMPMMLIHNYCLEPSKGTILKTKAPLIPKKLHYMWFGGKSLPESLEKCLESWRKYCPDYEIMEWNESNYDIYKHPYTRQAYEMGAYSFVSDYARLDVLYHEGGIYMDTDVELKRNIDDLLYQEAFCGVEKWQVINVGGMSGAVKGHPMIKKFLDVRKESRFIDASGYQNKATCGFYNTGVAIKEGYRINGMTQSIGGMNIYAYDWFHPYDYMSGVINETDNTHSVHWFNGGWMDEKMKQANEEAKRKYLELYSRVLLNCKP